MTGTRVTISDDVFPCERCNFMVWDCTCRAGRGILDCPCDLCAYNREQQRARDIRPQQRRDPSAASLDEWVAAIVGRAA